MSDSPSERNIVRGKSARLSETENFLRLCENHTSHQYPPIHSLNHSKYQPPFGTSDSQQRAKRNSHLYGACAGWPAGKKSSGTSKLYIRLQVVMGVGGKGGSEEDGGGADIQAEASRNGDASRKACMMRATLVTVRGIACPAKGTAGAEALRWDSSLVTLSGSPGCLPRTVIPWQLRGGGQGTLQMQ